MEKLNIFASRDIFMPVTTVNTIEVENGVLENAINDENEWLCSYRINNDCWSSFHASRQRQKVKIKDESAIMPLIRKLL